AAPVAVSPSASIALSFTAMPFPAAMPVAAGTSGVAASGLGVCISAEATSVPESDSAPLALSIAVRASIAIAISAAITAVAVAPAVPVAAIAVCPAVPVLVALPLALA